MFTTAAQKELNQWNQSHLNNLGGGEEKKKKKRHNRKQNPSAVQVYRLLGLKRGKEVSAGMNEGLWEGWAKEGSREETRRLE